MTKRQILINEAVAFVKGVENPTKNLPSHIAMRRYATDFAAWCARMGYEYNHEDGFWYLVTDGKKYSPEYMIDRFDPE